MLNGGIMADEENPQTGDGTSTEPAGSKTADDGLELDLDEGFHRKKRTVMLLSASAILLGCSTGLSSVIEATKVLTGQPQTSADTLRFALVLGAFYYAWGFGHAVLAAVRKNKDRMSAGQLTAYLREVEFYVEQTRNLHATTADLHHNAKVIADSMPGKVDEIIPPLATESFEAARMTSFDERTMLQRQSKDPDIQERLAEERRKEEQMILQGIRMAAVEKIAELGRSIEMLISKQKQVAISIRNHQHYAVEAARRIRLNRNIYRDRWIDFWLWEVGATTATFAIAVLFTFTTLGFDLGKRVDQWVPSPPSVAEDNTAGTSDGPT